MPLFVALTIAGGALCVSGAESSPCPHSCCEPAQMPVAAPAHLTDKSIYQLDSTWTNDAGGVVNLASLRGRPQIVTMFFAHCAYACPMLAFQMKQIEAALPEALRNKVGFVLVTFDTERDTPTALHAYRVQHDLEKERWTLLRGGPDDVLDLAALLNVKFKKDAQGQFLHSNVITLLNADGEIAFQQLGLNVEQREIIQRASQLAAR